MGQKYSLNVDISIGIDSYEVSHLEYDIYCYYDKNKLVRLSEDVNPQIDPKLQTQLFGYKRYTHEKDKDTLYNKYLLGKINYRSEEQTGLTTSSRLPRHVSTVYVFYWKNDHDNLFPLLVGVKGNKHVVYSRKYGSFASNNWKSSGIHDPDNPSNYYTELGNINTNFKNIIILDLNVTDTKNYCAHPYVYPCTGASEYRQVFPELHVDKLENTPIQGYVRFRYYFKNKEMIKVIGSCWKSEIYSFNNNDILREEWNEIYVYFPSGGNGSHKPLLVELIDKRNKNKNTHYYIFNLDGFSRINDVSRRNLLGLLDKLNCKFNSAHIFDISKFYSHNCPYCNVYFKVKTEEHTRYTNCSSDMHVRIGRIKSGHISLTLDSISFPINTMDNITVFYTTFGGSKVPFLIRIKYESKKTLWFKMANVDGKWRRAENCNDIKNDPEIIKILEEMEEIVKLCSITNSHTSSSAGHPNQNVEQDLLKTNTDSDDESEKYGSDEYPNPSDETIEKPSFDSDNAPREALYFEDNTKLSNKSRLIGLCSGVAGFVIVGGLIGISDRLLGSKRLFGNRLSELVYRRNLRQAT